MTPEDIINGYGINKDQATREAEDIKNYFNGELTKLSEIVPRISSSYTAVFEKSIITNDQNFVGDVADHYRNFLYNTLSKYVTIHSNIENRVADNKKNLDEIISKVSKIGS